MYFIHLVYQKVCIRCVSFSQLVAGSCALVSGFYIPYNTLAVRYQSLNVLAVRFALPSFELD